MVAAKRQNPFLDPEVAARYERWYETDGRRAARSEKALLGRLLARFPGATHVLEIGCGTGHFTRWMASRGLRVIGLDSSLPMLARAGAPGAGKVVQGDALDLPFGSRSFDIVVLITVLEFVGEPLRVLEEAVRVARRGLVLGALNRASHLGRRLSAEGGVIWGAARFLDPGELAREARTALGGRRAEIVWRTTLWPAWPWPARLPWGGFIGMAIAFCWQDAEEQRPAGDIRLQVAENA